MAVQIALSMVSGLASALAGKAAATDLTTVGNGLTAATGAITALVSRVTTAEGLIAAMPPVPVLRSTITTTSGTTADFTSIPPTASRIVILVAGFSHSSGSNATPIIRLGTSSGFETASYVSVGSVVLNSSTTGSASINSGFHVSTALTSSAIVDSAVMTLTHVGGNFWQFTCTGCNSSSSAVYSSAGYKLLPSVLNSIRLTTDTGATFDAGFINIRYE